jgi:phosphatidylserine/phosphatidylglycerophosphate/cardiolipin synthase-like enzyme
MATWSPDPTFYPSAKMAMDAPKEELAMGIRQARAIQRIRDVAHECGHRVGFYYTVAVDERGEEVATYIHSKLIVVDDRFLSFGSANLSNRSMGVDTELNLAFEDESPRSPLGRAIKRVRVSLLAEHVGATPSALRKLVRGEGLVERLDAVADEKVLRLRKYEPVDPSEDAPLMSALHASVGRYLDPERPRLDEDLETPERWLEILTRGIRVLRKAQ